MSDLSKYSIKDLEQISGIKAHTLRIWEKRYGLLRPDRTDTNIRYYSHADLKHLLNISLLNKNGMKISRIARLSQCQIHEQVTTLTLIRTKDEDLIDNLVNAMIDLDQTLFLNTFSNALLRLGFEQTMLQIIFPFFKRVGIMWQTDAVNPAQEHFVSNIVRQKLYVAIDALRVENAAQAPRALLFLPENELHELKLLFYHYALRARGVHTIYLGQSLSTECFPRIITTINPQYLITAVSNESLLQKPDAFICKVAGLAVGASLFISGNIAAGQSKQLPANVYAFKDLGELLGLLKL